MHTKRKQRKKIILPNIIIGKLNHHITIGKLGQNMLRATSVSMISLHPKQQQKPKAIWNTTLKSRLRKETLHQFTPLTCMTLSLCFLLLLIRSTHTKRAGLPVTIIQGLKSVWKTSLNRNLQSYHKMKLTSTLILTTTK